MIIQTLYGFVVTDVIFGVVSIVALGQCDITAHLASVFAEFCSPLRRSIEVRKCRAPSEGLGKRGDAVCKLHSKALVKTRLAINRRR